MQPDRTELLTRLMRERILIMDGAMGTMIQQHSCPRRIFAAACGCMTTGTICAATTTCSC
jgi:methionine synthase I (cobalamin-dependent)